jgi:two-component system, LytTR family, sensor kinase
MAMKFKARNYTEPAIHFILWTSLFLVLWFNVRTMGDFRRQDASIFPPLIWSAISNVLLFYINAIFLVPRLIPKHRYIEYIVYAVILWLSIVFINTFLDFSYAISLRSSEKEPFWSDLITNAGSKILILGLSIGYGLTKNWINSEKLRQQLIREKLDAELKVLKAQINPHFLFNTLNMAYASAVKSSDTVTADIIEKLSVLMRYVLYESNEDKVPLEKEINYVKNYINLQLQRLSDELTSSVRFEVKGECQNHTIAPMILIPFIENAFKHGIMLSMKPDISITVTLNHDSLILETRNLKNNLNLNGDTANSGIGLRNVRERLNLLYPDSHLLEINDLDNIFTVMLKIKL